MCYTSCSHIPARCDSEVRSPVHIWSHPPPTSHTRFYLFHGYGYPFIRVRAVNSKKKLCGPPPHLAASSCTRLEACSASAASSVSRPASLAMRTAWLYLPAFSKKNRAALWLPLSCEHEGERGVKEATLVRGHANVGLEAQVVSVHPYLALR
jgi:hypothetical protein